jgi:hypothetical protein
MKAFIKFDIKLFLLKNVPLIGRYRWHVQKFYKYLFYPLRYIPGSSLQYGPPRGLIDDSNFSSNDYKNIHISVIYFAESEKKYFSRSILNTNSELVSKKFNLYRKFNVCEKYLFQFTNARYISGNGGTLILSNDKILLSCSPLKNENNPHFHQSLYLFKLPKVEYFENVIIIESREADNNYGHWLRDFIPRLRWLLKISITIEDYILFINIRNDKFKLETYNVLIRLGFKFKEIRILKFNQQISAKKLLIPPVTRHGFQSDNEGSSFDDNLFVKNLFLRNDIQSNFKNLFISRRKSIRFTQDEKYISDFLLELGFKELLLEEYSVEEQAIFFRNAEIIVAFHGSGLANLVFCNSGITSVIEIFGPDYIVTDFWALANEINLDYHAFCSDEFYKGITNFRVARNTEVQVVLSDLMKYINQIIESKRIS